MKYLVFISLLFLAPLAQAEEWITEEVLKQLSEIRQELKVLQDEVRGLKSQVEKNGGAVVKAAKLDSVDISGSPIIGEESAKIAIVEFSDYQCPYCRRHFQQTLPDIEKNYIETGKVQYVMKQFPLGFHAKARGASIAALCLEKLKPGSYWKAHEAIFSGETALESAAYAALADSLKIDAGDYAECLEDDQMSDVVDRDMSEGSAVGVSGTPAFLVGRVVDGKVVDGRLITGARPYSSFSNILDDLL